MIIRGSGGGGEAKQPRRAIEASDTLRSSQFGRIVDLISEGEVEGLVGGPKGIYLDETPLQNADDSFNFNNVDVKTRNGTQTQTYLEGYSNIEAEKAVGVEIKKDVAVVRQISSPYVDLVKITLTIPALSSTSQETGDASGTSVNIAIDLQSNGGGFVEVTADTISGKSSSKYQRDYWVTLTGDGPWDIRVRRLTDDSTTQYLLNKTFWESYTEVIDTKLSYPNSALVGLTVESELFSSVPSRAYLMKGLRVKVPVNYDPVTRNYSGVWDGTFKVAWTDNPAWVFYDIVTNDRYGLGALINPDLIDVGSLYQISQYCDELVPDGYGGSEPRYTCNLYLQSREEAFTVISNIASIFNGMVFWGSGSITTIADMPSDTVWLFTNANVVDGLFEYGSSSISQRRTVALVSWNDPDDRYKQKVEYVEDPEGVAELGIRETEVLAIGSTSRGQAHRLGKRILLTDKMLSETVTFSTSLEAMKCYPGAVIGIQDNFRTGVRVGGRIVSASPTTITLDSSVTLEVGKTYTLSVILPNGTVEDRSVANASGVHTVINVSVPFSGAPVNNAMWVISTDTLETQLFKVVSVREMADMKWEISALQYNPSKFDAIDFDTKFEPLQTSNLSTVSPVKDLKIGEELFIAPSGKVENRMVISWELDRNADYYVVAWRYAEENWTTLPSVRVAQAEVNGVLPRDVEVSVKSVSIIGMVSNPAYKTATLLGKTAPPRDVENFEVKTVNQTAYLSWSPSADLDIDHYTIRFSPATVGVSWGSSSLLIPKIAHPTANAVVPSMTGTYLIKAVDDSGNESVNEAIIVSNVVDINSYNVLETLTEHPAFSGSKTNTVLSGGFLQLDNSLTGYYNFQDTIDLGGVFTSRVASSMYVFGTNLSGTIDTWVPLSSANPLSGVSGDTWSCIVEVRTTDDDTTGSPVWSDWEELTIGEYTCRGYQFRVRLASATLGVTPSVQELSVTVDMPDRVDGGEDIVCGVSGYTVTYPKAFKNSPAVGISAQGLTTGDYYVITNKSASGFTINFYNSSNVAIERTFDWVAKGYGYVIT